MNFQRTIRLVATAFIALTLAACAGTKTSDSTGTFFDDTVITTRVKSLLLGDATVSGTAVSVETMRGVVQLSGFVKTAAERSKAVELTRTVPGVKEVKNDILLR